MSSEDKDFYELFEKAEDLFNYLERKESSKRIYMELLEKNEEANAETEYIKGKIALIDKLYEKAIDYFDNSIILNETFFKPRIYKCFAFYKLYLYEDALKCINEVLKHKLDKIDKKYALQVKANALNALSKFEEALRCINEALKIDPKDALLITNRGVYLHNLKRYDEATKCYDKALEINSNYLFPLVSKGSNFKSLKKYEESLECHDHVLSIDHNNVRALIGKASTLSELGNDKKALKYLNKALIIESDNISALIIKADILGRSMNEFEEAIRFYDKALKINPKYKHALNNKSVCLNELGKFNESLEYSNKVLEMDSNYVTALLNKARSLDALGKHKESTEFYDKAYNITKSEIREAEKALELDVQNEVRKELEENQIGIFNAKKKYESELSSRLKPREKPLDGDFLMVLRRWNSYTPSMLTDTDSNVGGGYYIHWKGKGIVIDPGFDFLDNFFKQDFKIFDIDAVIITHAHIDHINDFESLLTLLFEYNETNDDQQKQIDVFLNLGAMKKLLSWIPVEETSNDKMIRHVYPLEVGMPYNLEEYNFTLKATNAIHDEVLTKTYSVGLIFEFYDDNEDKPFVLGYTSDTRHDETIEEQYRDVNLIIPHMGSIDQKDFGYKVKNIERNKNHLMLTGVSSTIFKSNAELAIISEFGEELGEHRVKVIHALDKVFQNSGRSKCLTGDIGLKIKIPDLEVKCHYCNKYVGLNDILEGIDPVNEREKAVIHFCKKCERTFEYEKNSKEINV